LSTECEDETSMKLLVANRGEIARRVFRTAKRLNWTTIAIFAEPDNDAAFVNEADISVCIGGQDLADSYLNQEKILEQLVMVIMRK